MASASSTDAVQAVLMTLHGLSVRSGQLSERLGYRFAACHAYGEIPLGRLLGLRESATPHGSTLSAYIGNRINPALATCTATEPRIGVLTDKVERTVSLLDVRIGLDLQI